MSDVIDLSEEPRPRRWIPLWLGAWLAVVVIEAFVIRTQSSVPFKDALLTKFLDYASLALLSLGVARVSESLARRRLPAPALIGAHLGIGLITLTIWKSAYGCWLYFWLGPRVWEMIFAKTWMYQLVSAVTTYGTLLGIILALQSSRRERERERREARLEIATREAQLAAVKAQLNPHFILNSLNSMLALVKSDPARVGEMILGLSELLQAAFHRLDDDEVTLEREIELVRRYLQIEKIRFGEHLSVTIDVAAGANDVPVPPLILQPIVENAIKHGVSIHARPGEVRVSARRNADRLLIDVRDNGDGCDPSALEGDGLGVSITRRRLEGVYRSDYRLSFERIDGGFVVRLDLPVAMHA
ncbi:MAG TPA: histidine kinase [Thermoanaerobaculia bacterium]|nr:histidine kinase [Thermoanaerobaculia bacterium]